MHLALTSNLDLLSLGLATAAGSVPHASSPSPPLVIGGSLPPEDAAADARSIQASPSTAHHLDKTIGSSSSVMNGPNGSDIDRAYSTIYPAPTPAPGWDPMPTVTLAGADVSPDVVAHGLPLPDDNDPVDDPSSIHPRYASIDGIPTNGSGHSGRRPPNGSTPSALLDSTLPHSLPLLGLDNNTMIDPNGSSNNGVHYTNGGSMIAAPVHATEQPRIIMDPATRLVLAPLPDGMGTMDPSFPAHGTFSHDERSIAAGRSASSQEGGASPYDSAASDGGSDGCTGLAAAFAPRIFTGTGGALPLPAFPAHVAPLVPPPLVSTGPRSRIIGENDDDMHLAEDGGHLSDQASEEGGASPTSSGASDEWADGFTGAPAAIAPPAFVGTGGALPLPTLPMLAAQSALLMPPPLVSTGPRSRVIGEADDDMRPAEDHSSDAASEEGGQSNEAMGVDLEWRDESFDGDTEVLHMQDPQIIQARSMGFAKSTCDQLYRVLHAGRTEEERRERDRQTPRRYVVTAELGAGAHGYVSPLTCQRCRCQGLVHVWCGYVCGSELTEILSSCGCVRVPRSTVFKAVRVVRQKEQWDAEANTTLAKLTVTGPPVALKRIDKGAWVPDRHMTVRGTALKRVRSG